MKRLIFVAALILTACGPTSSVEEECRACDDLSSERQNLPICKSSPYEGVPSMDPALYRALPDCLSTALVGKAKSDVWLCTRNSPCAIEPDPTDSTREAWLYCAEAACSPACWWSTRVYFDGNTVDHLRIRKPYCS